MPHMPRGVAEPREIIKHFDTLGPFPPGVVNLRYTVDDDWSGDPAIWRHQSQRNRFARMFDHGRMNTCSSKVSSRSASQ
jgi:hypothetical protein